MEYTSGGLNSNAKTIETTDSDIIKEKDQTNQSKNVIPGSSNQLSDKKD